jgi:predicted DNA-binding transcriptional regulator AlpA
MHALNANTAGGLEHFRASDSDYQPGTNSGTSLVPEQKLGSVEDTPTTKDDKRSLTANQEGFSDFFESTAEDVRKVSGAEPERNQDGTKPEPILSLKEAVEFYKISEKTIRLHIKDGKIPARKEEGPRGLEWRIYPQGLPKDIHIEETTSLEPEFVQVGSDVGETVTTVEEDGTTMEPVRYQPGSSPETTWYADAQVTSGSQGSAQPSFAPELKSLLDVITKQAEKLEAASMRIGYLEARTENYETQIKLLTDSQHKSGWWARFGAWFLGHK